MNMKLVVLSAGLALLSEAAVLGAEGGQAASLRAREGRPVSTAPRSGALPAEPADEANLRIEVSAKYEELQGSTRFVVGNGSQANHVAGGDKAFAVKSSQGTGVEFKRWGFIVNVLPTVNPVNPGEVVVQLQVELSGPVKGLAGAGEGLPNAVPNLATWQFQSAVTLVKGRKTVVCSAPARVEVTVDDAKPD
ncbi:MAG: hypothetical protein HY927_14980 [Elusimicrobia bacterium]|nr:hypothetical protein [Elusimicrobiota bacterium]